jgi:putative ABC transport system substrate-binding protein
MVHVTRRQFITLLGGAAAAWPLAARAQQPAMPVIGFISAGSRDVYAELLAAFRQGLKETGYVEDQNVAIESRWAEGQLDRLPRLAADLVQRRVAVMVTTGGSSSRAAKAASPTIPLVFLSQNDPIETGLVASFNRPGGNATGVNFFTTELEPKRLGLLRELTPTAALTAVLLNPTNTFSELQSKDIAEAAPALGLKFHIVHASTEQELDAAFATITQIRAKALLVGSDPFFNSRRDRVVALAARNAIPAIYEWREFAAAGGLMSWHEPHRHLSPSRRLYRTRPQRRQASRSAGSAIHQVRVRHQPEDREGAWPGGAARLVRPRRRGDRMKRREFIAALGAAAAGWPLAARAQQSERMRRIGVLMGVADDREGQARVTALKQGLQDLGWTDGRNTKSKHALVGATSAAYGLTQQK